MIFEYLKRGVTAGLVAGLAYGLYIALVATPLLTYIHEVGHDHGHGDSHGHGHDHSHAVAETTNAIVSIGSGVLWGILLAAVFAIAYYFLEPALPGRTGGKVAVLGAAGFFSVSVVPWLVLPPAAPGAEASLGIDARLAIYTGLIVLGVLVSAVAIGSFQRLKPAGYGRAVAIAIVPIVSVVIVLATVPPTIISHPNVADDLVYAFQGSAFLSQAALWTIVVGTFARLQGRAGTAPTSRNAETDGLLATS